jgi:hypothetical protein
MSKVLSSPTIRAAKGAICTRVRERGREKNGLDLVFDLSFLEEEEWWIGERQPFFFSEKKYTYYFNVFSQFRWNGRTKKICMEMEAGSCRIWKSLWSH